MFAHYFSLSIRLLVLVLLACLAVYDIRERRLPNRLVLWVAIAFFAYSLLTLPGWTVFLSHVAVGFAALCFCMGLVYLNLFGGGDAKLAGAVFLWAGTLWWLPMTTVISVIGTFVGLLSFVAQKLVPGDREGGRPLTPICRTFHLFSAARGVPYGVAIAAGGAFTVALPWLVPVFVSLFMPHPTMR